VFDNKTHVCLILCFSMCAGAKVEQVKQKIKHVPLKRK